MRWKYAVLIDGGFVGAQTERTQHRPPTAQDVLARCARIARLALRGLVDTLVVVTGDSDLIPAFEFARREGVRVLLDPLGAPVRRELRTHADAVLGVELPTARPSG
jgi:predicted TIM-barrel fold metal-dependent hydrolase